MKVSIVIPNYNGKKLLERNLPKVIKECQVSHLRPSFAKATPGEQDYGGQAGVRCQEIIVVDDASTDKSIEWLTAYSLQLTAKNIELKIIRNEKNFGFASTVNRGIREAKGEIVVLLNTDVYPERGFLEAVLPHFKDPKVFAVGMMDKSLEDGKIVRRGRGIGEWQRGFYVHRRGEVNKTDTFWVAGGSGAFRKSIFLKLGGFNPIYNPFYWEDIDLSYRAVKAGYKILFEPKSVVVHEHEKGAIKGAYSEEEVKLIAYRNQFLFVWKNANLKQWLSHLLWLPYHLVKALFRGDYYFIVGFFKAIFRVLRM